MGHYKKLYAWLTGKKDKPKLWPANCQCARILEALCEGQRIGGREACQIIRSHNGARRLRQVIVRLQASGVLVGHAYTQAKHGNKFKLTFIMPGYFSAARKLIGKGA